MGSKIEIGKNGHFLFALIFCLYVAFYIFSNSSNIRLPEEALDLDSGILLKALISGYFESNLEISNPTVLGAIPWAGLDFLTHDVIGLDLMNAYRVKLIIRFIFLLIILLYIINIIIEQKIISILIVGFTVFNFNLFHTLTYSSKYAMYTLLLGTIIIFISSNKKKVFLIYFIFLILSIPLISNLGNIFTSILFLPIGIYIFSNKCCLNKKFFLKICLLYFMVYFPLIVIFHFRQNMIDHYQNYASKAKLDIEGPSILQSAVGSGYWAENLDFGKLKYFSWAPESDLYFYVRQAIYVTLFVLIVMSIIGIRFLNKYRFSDLNRERAKLEKSFYLSLLFLFMASVPVGSSYINSLFNSMPYILIYREPWTKFTPIYLILFTLTLAFTLRILLKGSFIDKSIVGLITTLVFSNSALFIYASVKATIDWRIDSSKELMVSSEDFIVYSQNQMNKITSDFTKIDNLAKDAKAQDMYTCIELNSNSPSLNRDMNSFGRLNLHSPTIMNWNAAYTPEGNHIFFQSWNCFARIFYDKSIKYINVLDLDKFKVNTSNHNNVGLNPINVNDGYISDCIVSKDFIFVTFDAHCINNLYSPRYF